MTNHEIFIKVKNHLLKQNKRCEDADLHCLYRDNIGNTCAIGCLITKKNYSSNLEGKLAHSSEVTLALQNSLKIKLNDNLMNMLGDLQSIHDSTSITSWKQRLNTMETKLFGKRN